MSHPNTGPATSRALPPRPSLEFLRNEAKRRLEGLRASQSGAKLSEAQFQIAREYGFASWRALKAEIERAPAAGPALADPTGDWVAHFPGSGISAALHVAADDRGGWRASFDVPAQGYFDDPVDGLQVDDDRLAFEITVRGVNVRYEADWDAAGRHWRGTWRQSGRAIPLEFRRGLLPPAPTVEGLDGLWDGRLDARDVRLTIRVRTDARGTAGWLETSRQSGTWFPASTIRRDGQDVAILMKTVKIEGRLSDDGRTIDARWIRDGVDAPLVLNRRAPGALPPRGPTPKGVDLPGDVLRGLAGHYALADGVGVTLGLVDGVLRMLDLAGRPFWELVPTSATAFFARELDADGEFELDDHGRPIGLVVRYGGRETRYRRVE